MNNSWKSIPSSNKAKSMIKNGSIHFGNHETNGSLGYNKRSLEQNKLTLTFNSKNAEKQYWEYFWNSIKNRYRVTSIGEIPVCIIYLFIYFFSDYDYEYEKWILFGFGLFVALTFTASSFASLFPKFFKIGKGNFVTEILVFLPPLLIWILIQMSFGFVYTYSYSNDKSDDDYSTPMVIIPLLLFELLTPGPTRVLIYSVILAIFLFIAPVCKPEKFFFSGFIVQEGETSRMNEVWKHFILEVSQCLFIVIFSFVSNYFNEKDMRHHFKLSKKIAYKIKYLDQQKKTTDNLIMNVIPEKYFKEVRKNLLRKSMKEEFKKNMVMMDKYDNLTVLMTDFVDFTKFCSSISPKVLVKILNIQYSSFDRLCIKHKVEKIKTIGDAYFALIFCKRPEEEWDEEEKKKFKESSNTSIKSYIHYQKKHDCLKMVKLALEAFDEVEKMNSEYGWDFHMRAGVSHDSGYVTVFGNNQISFDVIGRVKVIADFLENKGTEGKVQVDGNVFDYSNHAYYFTKREIKKHPILGDIETYLCLGEIEKNETDVSSSSCTFSSRESLDEYGNFVIIQKDEVEKSFIIDEKKRKIEEKKLKLSPEELIFGGVFPAKVKWRKIINQKNNENLVIAVEKSFDSEKLRFSFTQKKEKLIKFNKNFIVFSRDKFMSSKKILQILIPIYYVFNVSLFLYSFVFGRFCVQDSNESYCYGNNYKYVIVHLVCLFILLVLGASSFLATYLKSYGIFVSFVLLLLNCVVAYINLLFIIIIRSETIAMFALSYNSVMTYALLGTFLNSWLIFIGVISSHFPLLFIFNTSTATKALVIVIMIQGFGNEHIRNLLKVRLFKAEVSFNEEKEKVDKRHDTNIRLLLSFLPKDIVKMEKSLFRDELSEFSKSVRGSILFCKVSGFYEYFFLLSTELRNNSEMIKHLIEFLNTLFTQFDILCEKNNVTKIKTNGEMYLCAYWSGDEKVHSRLIVKQASKFQKIFKKTTREYGLEKKSDSVELTCKIGINSGHFSTAIVGTEKYLFDIFGTAVNLSARICQNSRSNSILVSEKTAKSMNLDSKGEKEIGLKLIARGKTFLKGIGSKETYWVEDCRKKWF